MDGRNPAVDRWFIPVFIGFEDFQVSKVMQDFCHPQYKIVPSGPQKRPHSEAGHGVAMGNSHHTDG